MSIGGVPDHTVRELQPPISYIYRGGVTTLRTREWSLISSPSRHGVHRMHGLDGAAGYRIETCRLCACTAQPLLRPKQLPGPPLACWTLTPFFQAVFATLSMMAAAITVRIHWRCAHVVQICLGDHHRLLESSPPAHGRRLRRGCRALSPAICIGENETSPAVPAVRIKLLARSWAWTG